ncbi:MAG TPA: GMC family oxidoreductase N-terminal domain-containing protein [Solirubrobacteraceae bacterium]
MTGFDAIVIGAGSAGSVVTRRLADAGSHVLLLEAGAHDINPAIHDPLRMGELWHSPDDWGYFTVAQAHAFGRRLHWPRGKVLGGSHALNAMIWVRGTPEDFDGWADAGADGWSWDDVLPVYRDIEKYDGGASELRGGDGLLDVVGAYELHPIQQAIIDAAVQTGLPHNHDYNGAETDGVSQQQITIRDGRRLSTYRAYVHPRLGSSNLDVVTGARVYRLIVEGGRIVGVVYERNGELLTVRADLVVLAAGTIGSPEILLRSGIGPADELAALGIDVVADCPGVGANLHDHLLCPVIFATDRELPLVPSGMSVTQTHLFWRSQEKLASPDTQPIHFSVPMYEAWMRGPASGFSLMAGLIRPKSRGKLRLSGVAPDAPLVLDPNILAQEDDLLSLEASVRQCREIGMAPALAEEWGAHEIYPGPDVDTADALRDYVRRTAITYHHQVGTLRMGSDAEAVVDPKLALNGLEGVVVADASVMPAITSGNTNAPAVLIGERASRFILKSSAQDREAESGAA